MGEARRKLKLQTAEQRAAIAVQREEQKQQRKELKRRHLLAKKRALEAPMTPDALTPMRLLALVMSSAAK